jgi:hypothetical protein
MPQGSKTAGAAAQMPIGQPARGRTGRLAQATRTTDQGAAGVTAAKARLSGGQVRR